MLFYRCFQRVTVTKKIKTCGWRNVLVVRLESIKSPPARSASGVITRWRCRSVCLSVCLFAVAGTYRVDTCLLLCLLWYIVAVDHETTRRRWLQFLVGLGIIVHRQCRSTSLPIVYSALSATRVHSRQTKEHCRQWSQRSVTDIPGE